MQTRPDPRQAQALARLTTAAALFLAVVAATALGMVWLLLVLG